MSDQLNIIKAVDEDILELDVRLVHTVLFEWKYKGDTISASDLSNKIWGHRQQQDKIRIGVDNIRVALSVLECDKRREIKLGFKEKIKFETPLPDHFEQLAKMISQDKYDPMYPVILKHIVWTVKRRLFDLKDYCPIFLSIYGEAGTGKSEFVKAMFSIFPPSLKSNVSNAEELFNDERQTFRLVENYVVTMDELSGLNRADANKLKNQIDCEKVVYVN